MNLGERLSLIVQELGIAQNLFAKSLGKNVVYINQLIKGKKSTISLTLALLIQELYGYSANWILTGEGDRKPYPELEHMKKIITKKISYMPNDELIAVLAFAQSLDSVKAAFQNETD